MPTMADVNECVAIVLERRKVERESSDAKDFLREMASAKRVWEREREEERQKKLRESAEMVQVSTEVSQ
ncbi:hypothetical protein [Terriglobus sp. ADX1]|uniref:hypothetical protein n=1 Tax=Terriglobus sp. ADX1 TaxID=2794063 RepID=UPI002FE4FEB2